MIGRRRILQAEPDEWRIDHDIAELIHRRGQIIRSAICGSQDADRIENIDSAEPLIESALDSERRRQLGIDEPGQFMERTRLEESDGRSGRALLNETVFARGESDRGQPFGLIIMNHIDLILIKPSTAAAAPAPLKIRNATLDAGIYTPSM